MQHRRRRLSSGPPLSLSVALAGALALAPIACKEESRSSATEMLSAAPAPASAPGTPARSAPANDGGGVAADRPTASPASAVPSQRKIIRTGSLTLEVANYEKVRDAVAALVRGSGGFVASAEVARSEGSVSSAVLVLRIPEPELDGAIAALSRLGTVRGESIRAEDVTDQVHDLDARLRNAKRLEERLLELAAKAGGIKDLLDVEREVARVREGIEVMDGQLRVLADRTALATLTVNLISQGTYKPEPDPGLMTKIRRAFDTSVSGLAAAGEALLLFLVAAAPWILPIAIPAFVLRRRLLRRWKR